MLSASSIMLIGTREPPHVAQLVEAQVPADAEQPRTVVRAVAAVLEPIERLDERVLHEVETGVVIEAHAPRVPVYRILMAMHEVAYACVVAVQHAHDDLRIRRLVLHRNAGCSGARHRTTSTAT